VGSSFSERIGPSGLSPITGSWPCWKSTRIVSRLSRIVLANAPGAKRSMKLPSKTLLISVHWSKTAKWPVRVGIVCPSARSRVGASPRARTRFSRGGGTLAPALGAVVSLIRRLL
jgi:hypothetical protein